MFKINAKIKGIDGTIISEHTDVLSLEFDLLYIRKEKINSYTLEIDGKTYSFNNEGISLYDSKFTEIAINLLRLNKTLIERDINDDKELDIKYEELATNYLKILHDLNNTKSNVIQDVEDTEELEDMFIRHTSTQGNIYYIRQDCMATDHPIINDVHLLNVYKMCNKQGQDDEDLTDYIEEMKRRNIKY